jgi:hypothetical protein
MAWSASRAFPFRTADEWCGHDQFTLADLGSDQLRWTTKQGSRSPPFRDWQVRTGTIPCRSHPGLTSFCSLAGHPSWRGCFVCPSGSLATLANRDNHSSSGEPAFSWACSNLDRQQVPTLFNFAHGGVQACHREPHSAMNCGLSDRRYTQRSRACGTCS